MRALAATLLLLLPTAVCACSTTPGAEGARGSALGSEDAGAGGIDLPVAPLARAPARSAAEVVARLRALAPFAVGQGALERREGFYALRDERLPWRHADAARTRVRAPARADGPLRLEDAAHDGAWLEVTPLDVAAREPLERDGALVFLEVAQGVDLVYSARPSGLEESRVVHAPGAEVRASYRVRLGPSLAELRVRRGALEAVDEAGVARMGAPAPLAIDARGTRRVADVTLTRDPDGALLVVTLDARGLVAPIVLDPVWTLLTAMSSPRRQHTAWSLASGKVLVAGGHFDPESRQLSTSEVFAPSTDTWATTSGTMKVSHAQGFGLVLSGRRVLLGGYSAELG